MDLIIGIICFQLGVGLTAIIALIRFKKLETGIAVKRGYAIQLNDHLGNLGDMFCQCMDDTLENLYTADILIKRYDTMVQSYGLQILNRDGYKNHDELIDIQDEKYAKNIEKEGDKIEELILELTN